MPTNNISKPSTTSYVQPEYSYKNKREFSEGLDSNAFMKLMIAQLANQDPLSPMDNSQFVMQTSMMTLVEKLTNIEKIMKETNSSLLNVKEYEKLIGKVATYDVIRKDEASGQQYVETAQNTINGVKLVDGDIWFLIGKDIVSRGQIHGLESLDTDIGIDNTLKYADMIGYKATYLEEVKDEDGKITYKESTGIIEAISMKDGMIEFIMDNGKKVKSIDIIGLQVGESPITGITPELPTPEVPEEVPEELPEDSE
ncbi:flagellar hook assembly protein FlgD [Brevibacillus daliensis]|uniref:flagellar hook assembly protein FlgD n=1 Tax=Brevibacillus daliensis TaxID=2892995 RepID=UPI001E4F2782|nr:flagellar hook capping FlgD N-terminal domain-containing protein [Brevibacillus daliensis]